MINYFSLHVKTLTGELSPDLKANLNEWTINTTYNTQSTEYYKTDISKYISFSINIGLTEILRLIYRICLNSPYVAAFMFWLQISAVFNIDCEFQYHISLFK